MLELGLGVFDASDGYVRLRLMRFVVRISFTLLHLDFGAFA